MTLLKKLRKEFTLEVSSDSVENNIKLYRIYCLLGAFFSFFIGVLLSSHETTLSLIVSWSIPALFIVIWLLSYKVEFFRKQLVNVIFFFFLIISGYAFFNFYKVEFKWQGFMGYALAVFCISMAMQSRKHVIIYGLINTALCISIWFLKSTEVSALFCVIFIALITTVSYLVVSFRKKIAAKLKDDERFLATILNSSHDAILLVDYYSRKVINCNNMAIELFEVDSEEEIVGFERDKFEVNKTTQEQLNVCRKELSIHGIWTSVEEFQTKKGKRFWGEIIIKPLTIQKSQYYVTRISDITQKKEDEEALRLSEQKNQSLLAAIPDLMFVIDKDGYYKDYKASNKALLINPNQTIIGKNVKGSGLGERVEKIIFSSIEEVLKYKEPRQYQYDLNLASGRKYFEARMVAMSDDEVLTIVRDVTQDQEQKEQLGLILQNIDELIYNISIAEDNTRIIEYISPKAKELFGLDVNEYKNEATGALLKRYHPNDLDRIRAVSEQIKVEKQPVSLVYRFKPKGSDTYIWLEEKVFPKFENNKHTANFGIIRNVTERIESQEALRLSEERYRTLFERNPSGVYRTDINRVVLECNDAFAQILGFESKEEVTNIKANELYENSSDKGEFLDRFDAKGRLKNHESWIELKNGKEIRMLENASLIYDEKGNPEYIEGTFTDITDLKNVQQALKDSEETLSMVLNSIDDLVYNVEIKEDGSKVFKYISPQIKQLIGFTAKEYESEVLKGKVLDYFHPDDIENVKSIINELNEKKQPIVMTYRYLSKDTKEYVWLEEKMFPKLDENGRHVANMGILRDVTERVIAEQSLKKSEEQYRTLVEKMNEGVVRVDKDEKIQYVNKRFAEILGYTEKELLGKEAYDMFAEDNLNLLTDAIKDRKKGVASKIEIKAKRKTGENVWVELSGAPIYDDESNVTGSMGIVTDITERRDAEEAVRLSEERYRTLFERNLAGVFRTTVDGKILECNDAFAKILGYGGRVDILNKRSIDLYFNEKDRDVYLEDLLTRGFLTNYEICHKRKDGSKVWVLANVTLTNDDEGNPEHIEGTFIDITELKITGEALVESEEKFRLLFSEANDAILIMDNENYIDCNEKTLEMFACKKEEIIGRSPFDFSPQQQPDGESSYDKTKDKIAAALKGITQSFYWKHVKQNGTPFDAEVSLNVFELGSQKFLQAIIRDITERKEAERAIIESEERFRLLSEATIEGIIISEGRKIIDANDQFAILHGYNSRIDVIGMNIEDFVVPEEMKAVEEYITAGYDHTYEVRSRKKNGDVITLESRGEYIPYNGNTVRVSVVYDITARKKIEEALKERERAMATLLGNLPGMAYRCKNDEKRTVEFVSNGCKELTGYEAEELINNKKVAFAALNVDGFDNIKKHLKKSLKDKIPFVLEYKISSATGEEKWVWEQGEGVYNNDGKLIAVEGFVADITERKNYEKNLRKSQESFKNLVEYSPDGILIHVEGVVRYVNPSALKLLGVKNSKDLIGTEFTNVLLSEYKNTIEKRIKRLKRGEHLKFEEVKAQRKDGTVIELGLQSVNINYNGMQAIQVILHDLTYQKQLAKEQLRAQVAEETNKTLEKEIKEHKNTQRKLEVAQKFTRNIIDSSLDMIIATDVNNEITEFNKAAIEQFGYSEEEIKGKSPRTLYAFTEEFKKIRKELADHGSYSGEITNVAKNGEMFTTYLAASLLKNEEGVVLGAMGVSRDITEIKRAEEELRKSEERYRDLFENATDFIQSIDNNGNFIYVNNAWKKAMGYNDEDIKEMNMFDIIHPESREHCEAVFSKIFDGESVENIETTFVSKKGKAIDVVGNASIRFENGTPHSTRSIFRDVTEAKQAEKNAQEQAAKIQSIFDSSPHMMIWTLDKQLRITSLNENFKSKVKQQFNLDVNEGDRFLEMVTPFIKPTLRKEQNNFYKQATKGKPQHFEGPMKDKNGETVWFESFLNPIRLEKGKIHEIACIAHEITDKKLTEKQIKQSLEEKDVLLKEVHHRVKNNLQVISSILNLQSSYVKDENTLEILKESQNRIKSMSFIHESLYQTKNFSSIDFSDYILNLSKNLVHSYRVYKDLVELKLDIDQVYLNLDQAIPCGLIVNELVSNALKYAFPDDKEIGYIRIRIKEVENKVQIEVEDNGIGLPEGFDYKQTDSLGLQLVSALVDQLDGEIELETKNGTKYLITFDQQT